jgi:deaminated glutathione amidase
MSESSEPMASGFRVALLQTTSTNEAAENIAALSQMIRDAAAAGADFVMMPETAGLMERSTRAVFEKTHSEGADPGLAAFRALAAELGVWILIGSLAIRISDDKLANRSFLISGRGEIVARYDKIHMFDVDLPNGETYRESKNYQPGAAAVVAETPWGPLGMSVCYDLRFPYLYRALAKAGAQMLTVPAAFTRPTGEAHWHLLLRARAVETGCFVFAPAQCGTHVDGRETYGHSLVVAPWGEVLEDGGEVPGVVLADIDFARVAKARSAIPSLTHDRDFSGPES